MIESIKISQFEWHKNDAINKSVICENQDNMPKQKIDTEKMIEQAKQYFYKDEHRGMGKEEKSKETQISSEQIDDLIKQGYEVEEMTLEELERMMSSLSSDTQGKSRSTEYVASTKSLDNKIDRLQEHTDGMYIHAMNSQGKLSINDLYKGSFSGGTGRKNASHSPLQIQDVLKLNGVENTKGNEWAASKLLSLGLDVSKNDIIKVQNIKSAVDALQKSDRSQSEEDNIELGQIFDDTPIIEDEKILYVEKDMQDIIDDITKVDEQDIRDNISEGKEITIGNLREIMHRNTDKVLKRNVGNQGEAGVGSSDLNKQIPQDMSSQQKLLDAGTITIKETGVNSADAKDVDLKVEKTKEQLKEIRARLNVQAAIKISEKMPLESTELSKIAKELMTIEDAKVDMAIQKAEIPATSEVKEMIKDTLRATYLIGGQKENAVGMEVVNEGTNTLEEMTKVISSYEENFLQTERRFGETVVKVEGQIEEFLNTNNIPATKENIEAAKALITNQLELTTTNIENTAKVINKVNTFLEEMTPERAALLIKEGVNPYKSSISNILEWTSLSKLPSLKNSIAEAIVGLEDSGQINETQKKSLLGLYRIIGGVTQNKEQVVGYMFKNELPLTIEKLEEATKYAKQTEHIEVEVNDEFGELEEVKYKEVTAKQMIEGSIKENNKLLDAIKVLENTGLPISKESISKISEINSMIYPFIKSQIKRELGKFEGVNSLAPSTIEKLNTIKDVSPEVVEAMSKQNIPVTISNLYWMQKLVDNPHLYGQLMKEQNLAKENFPRDIEEFELEIEELEKEISSKKESFAEKGDILGYRGYKQLEEVVGVQKQLIQKEGLYQIPFMIDGQPKVVNLYIQQDSNKQSKEKDSLKAVITYETKELGTVVAKIQMEKDKLSYSVQGESPEITNKLRRDSKKLDKMLDAIGYLITKSEYATRKSENAVINPAQIIKHSDSSFEEVI